MFPKRRKRGDQNLHPKAGRLTSKRAVCGINARARGKLLVKLNFIFVPGNPCCPARNSRVFSPARLIAKYFCRSTRADPLPGDYERLDSRRRGRARRVTRLRVIRFRSNRVLQHGVSWKRTNELRTNRLSGVRKSLSLRCVCDYCDWLLRARVLRNRMQPGPSWARVHSVVQFPRVKLEKSFFSFLARSSAGQPLYETTAESREVRGPPLRVRPHRTGARLDYFGRYQ